MNLQRIKQMNSKKVVVITGASRGIGRATAEKFISHGFQAYDLSRSGQDFEGCKHIYCDVTDYKSIEIAIAQIISESGQIDTAISNAGMGISGSLEGHDPEHIKKQIDINLIGSSYFAKAVLSHIRASKGRLLFMSSLAAEVPIPFQALYSVTKAGLKSLAMALDNEIKPSGARVCAIMPGDLKTSFTASRIKNASEDIFYKDRVEESISKMEKDELSGGGPEVIANKLYKLATQNNPKVISTVGLFYKSVSVLTKILPVRIKNWLIYKIYA